MIEQFLQIHQAEFRQLILEQTAGDIGLYVNSNS